MVNQLLDRSPISTELLARRPVAAALRIDQGEIASEQFVPRELSAFHADNKFPQR